MRKLDLACALNFARFDAKVEQRLGLLEARVDAKVASLEAKLDARLAWLEARFVVRLDAGLTGVREETAKWMFRSWATMMLAIIGVAVTVVLRSRGDPTGA